MANPQKENGYVSIANEIVEAFARHRLSGNEWQVLWVILRKTYGWNKKSDAISLSQISKMTGISRSHVAHTVAKLCNRGVAKKSNTYISTYEFQKDYSKWRVLPKKAPRCLNVQPPLPKRATKLLPKTAHTKDNKDTITKDKSSPFGFNQFWTSYPRKESKKKAMESFSKIKPDGELLKRIIKAVENQKKDEKWLRDGGRYIPMPATWLNQERWDDEITQLAEANNGRSKSVADEWAAERGVDLYSDDGQGNQDFRVGVPQLEAKKR